jgi:hypothetical protein
VTTLILLLPSRHVINRCRLQSTGDEQVSIGQRETNRTLPVPGQSHWCDGWTRGGNRCGQVILNTSERCEAGHYNARRISSEESKLRSRSGVASIIPFNASCIPAVAMSSESEEFSYAMPRQDGMHVRHADPFPLLDERPEAKPDQVTRRDVRPGLQFIREFPHLPPHPDGLFFEVVSKPQHGWVYVMCLSDRPVHQNPRNKMFLADVGIAPYQDGKWNPNWLRIVKPAPSRRLGLFARKRQ